MNSTEFEELLREYFRRMPLPAETPECPDGETLGLFAENRLPPERRADVETHVTTCRFCIGVIAAVLKTDWDELEKECPPEIIEAAERASLKFLEKMFGKRTFTYRRGLEIPLSSGLVLAEDGIPFTITFSDTDDELVIVTSEERFMNAELRILFMEGGTEQVRVTVRLKDRVWKGRFTEKAGIPSGSYTLCIVVTSVRPPSLTPKV